MRTRTWMILGVVLAVSFAVQADEPAKMELAEEAPVAKGPSVVFHTLEGVPGGYIVPQAYLGNPGPEGRTFGIPAFSAYTLYMGSKDVFTLSLTETLWRRVEVGFCFNYFDFGGLPGEFKKLGGDMEYHTTSLYHLNARVLLVEEDTYGLPLPAITAGVHYKHNSNIGSIDRALFDFIEFLGYDHNSGVDFTLTATKTFEEPLFHRPLILTAGVRSSEAAQLGYFGFGDHRATTFEGSVGYMPTDNLYFAYEYREKKNPYNKWDGLFGEEDDWHALSAAWFVTDRLTVSGMAGFFGNMANGDTNTSVGFQVKYALGTSAGSRR